MKRNKRSTVATDCKTSSRNPLYTIAPKFHYVEEWSDFLELFPHRFDYLYAEHPEPGDRPDWQSESRHPLSDRLIAQGAFLYGVRFGSNTHYLMLDIDRKSAYHPAIDPLAIGRISEALEPLGLFKFVAVQSSGSGGLHLYFPFPFEKPSWAVSQAAEILLERSGLKLNRGQLELFPNPKKDAKSIYNGHRLPLQAGSYLLNSDFQPIWTSRELFVSQWRSCLLHNSVGEEQIKHVMGLQRSKYRRMGMSAQKFLNDLNADIKQGWTGPGQTNRILGRIALREYVFFHVQNGGDPLSGSRLVDRVVEVAIGLAGYEQWCRHKHEIFFCAQYWARAAELSEYYPYKGKELAAALSEEQKQNWNLKQAEEARVRIIAAVLDLQSQNALPDRPRERMMALKAYGISSSTLYKNKPLWHPETLEAAPDNVIHPAREDEGDRETLEAAPGNVIHPVEKISLYMGSSEDAPTAQSSDNPLLEAVRGSGGFSTADGIAFIRSIVSEIGRRQIEPLEQAEPPPDETWFRDNVWHQLAMELEQDE